MPSPLTLILPTYQQPLMLQRQLEELNLYPPDVQVIIVDDGSPEPAEAVVRAHASPALMRHLRLYRVEVDIPWNRGMCRNLGAAEACTEFVAQLDIDHILPVGCVEALLDFCPDSESWYRFSRRRRGKADETRQKDALPRDCEYGQIKPHIDSHLMRRDLFLRAPYDESYSGALGGGTPFLARMERLAPVLLLPETIYLEVYTRHVIADASITTLSRDTSEYSRRRKQREASWDAPPGKILRLPWKQVL